MDGQDRTRIFVLGGTGYIGSAAVTACARAGARQRVLHRPASRSPAPAEEAVTAVAGDLADADLLRREAAQADAVLLAAAQYGPQMAAVDRASLEAVIDGARSSGARVVYISGSSIYAAGLPGALDEEAALDPPELLRFRPGSEAVLAAAGRAGLGAVALRPAWVYGDGGGVAGIFARQARKSGRIALAGEGDNRWSAVHRADLARLLARVLLGPPVSGVFNVADGRDTTQLAVAEAVAAGTGAVIEPLSPAGARAQYGLFADLLAGDIAVSAARAERELGWRPGPRSILSDWRAGESG